jgi:hypothetical protein
MTNKPPTVMVFCIGKKGEPHPPQLVDIYEQDLVDSPQIRQAQIAAGMEPQPHYWKLVERSRWKGELPRNRQPPKRLLGRREQADHLTAEQHRRAFFGGTSQADDLRLWWQLRCHVKTCGYRLQRVFGVINATFDELVEEGRDSIALGELEARSIDH